MFSRQFGDRRQWTLEEMRAVAALPILARPSDRNWCHAFGDARAIAVKAKRQAASDSRDGTLSHEEAMRRRDFIGGQAQRHTALLRQQAMTTGRGFRG
jgi:hypothetical protein